MFAFGKGHDTCKGASAPHDPAVYTMKIMIIDAYSESKIININFRINPPMLAVGSDEPNTSNNVANIPADKTQNTCNGKVYIYEYSEASRRWAKTDCLSSVLEPVNDLAFAPNLGRSFHLLAVATKDVRIIKIEPLA